MFNGGEVCIAEAFEVVRIKDSAPAEANAHLIAAAPDLFAALVKARGMIWANLRGLERDQLLFQIDAALLKASPGGTKDAG